MKVLLRALRFFRPDAPRIAGVFALLLVSIGANLLKPWPLALIVDCFLGTRPLPEWLRALGEAGQNVVHEPSHPAFLFLIAAMLVLHVGQGLISAVQNYISIGIGLRGLQRVRNEVFACLQRLSLRFHQGSKAGDLIYRASWDTYSFQTMFQQGLITMITAFLSLAMMVLVMMRLNWKLTLVALAIIPLLALTIRLLGRKMTEHGAAAQQADSAVTSLVQQNISAMPLIQSYAREDQEQETFTAQTASAQHKRLAQHGWELIYWLGISLVFAVGTTLTVWIGSRQVMAGELTVGQLWIFLAYLAQLYDPLNQLSHVGATLSTAGVAAGRVFELLDTPEEVKDAPDARPVISSKMAALNQNNKAAATLVTTGRVEFENITFGYRTGQTVLEGVNFQLKAGESAALIGPSGVGKSTLMNLLPRFYDPAAGLIKLEGVDLRTLKLKDLRSLIAVVLQEPILLPSTIADNIAYGKPGATLAEIEAAARAANAHEFILKLPKQYHTQVGDGAARLSVGERQRINLARAFLKDAPILLLDEPTSALDAESEAAVVASVFDLMKGRTTLMVAHRLTTIRRVDRILVLENGRLAENGSPAELLKNPNGYYTRVAGGQVELV
jgi:ATP-binding cassette subfamily B protein/subfamily B ATP-binding cassette protein MsbA